MRSFWTNNPCCPSWTGLFSSYITSHPPILLQAHPPPSPLHPISGCTFGRATEEDISQLPSFWEKWFSTGTSRCCIPYQRIRRSLDAGTWDIYVVRRDRQVIGTLVRRWITGFHVKGAYMPKAGIIDFFCVHPAWKRKGVGRTLLFLIHNATVRPMPPHLMFWESYLPTIPPSIAGIYWKKECVLGKRDSLPEERERQVWTSLAGKRAIRSEYRRCEDILTYEMRGGAVIIWNTWHRRIPQGDSIGIVLASTGSMDELYECSPFGLLLADRQYEGWEFNGAFQWGMYNMNTGFITTEFPLIQIQ